MSDKPKYPRQFISAVNEHIHNNEAMSKVVDFYYDNYSRFPAAKVQHDFLDFIYDTIYETFEGAVYREEIAPIIAKVKKSRLMKRVRWHEDYCRKMDEFNIKNKKHPLYDRIEKYEGDPAELIEKEKSLSEAWKNRGGSYFFEFPGYKTIGSASILGAVKTDIVLMTWDYVLNNLDGDIPFFYRAMPEEYVELPMFSSSSFKVLTKDGVNKDGEEIIYDENGQFLLSISLTEGSELKSTKVMDATDVAILSYVINQFERKLFNTGKMDESGVPIKDVDDGMTVQINASKLATFIGGYNPSEQRIEDVAKRCYKLSDYVYKRASSSGKLNIDDKVYLFSRARHIHGVDEKTGKPVNMIIFRITDVLNDIIVGQKLIRVAENSLNKLTDEAAKILYYVLERDRIALFQKNKPLEMVYPYRYFQRYMRFKSSDRAENLKIVENALKNFIDNEVCVKSIAPNKGKDGGFWVAFRELSSEEQEDLKNTTQLKLEKK